MNSSTYASYLLPLLVVLLLNLSILSHAADMSGGKEYYRKDGVRIQHDPYSEEMAAKYGLPGQTDNEGFDPYADSVGPGIYGGIVKRDASGDIIIGEQYQGHNPRPGPVYAGGGYTPTIRALQSGDLTALAAWLERHADLVNEVTTGGASPLHMCGMSRTAEKATALLIERGGDMEAVDTYGYRPLHRMASNNLAIGAAALLEKGADAAAATSRGETPMMVAQQSRALDVIKVLRRYVK